MTPYEFYNKTNILNLPKVGTINDDDYLIVQNDNNDTQTSLLQFKNFIIDLKNTTFEANIENLENNVSLLTNRFNYVVDCYNQSLNVLLDSPLNSGGALSALSGCYALLSTIA